MLGFQRMFDWDFMKINPRADYHVEDWGLKQHFSHNEFAKHTKSNYPVRKAEDWQSIRQLPRTAEALAEHLLVISKIRKSVGKDLPLFMTVFTPLAIAGRMIENQTNLLDHLRKSPEIVHAALESITKTFEMFVTECRNAGADGIFLATTQWASFDMITWEEYKTFGVPYDLRLLAATDRDALNILHVCASNNYLKQMMAENYPVQMVNWNASDPTNLPVDTAYEVVKNKAIVGGLDHEGWLRQSAPDEVAYLVGKLKKSLDPSRVILSPGCTFPPETPSENLRALRESLSL